MSASLHHIVEILGQFDLVALVELRDDVNASPASFATYWIRINTDTEGERLEQ